MAGKPGVAEQEAERSHFNHQHKAEKGNRQCPRDFSSQSGFQWPPTLPQMETLTSTAQDYGGRFSFKTLHWFSLGFVLVLTCAKLAPCHRATSSTAVVSLTVGWGPLVCQKVPGELSMPSLFRLGFFYAKDHWTRVLWQSAVRLSSLPMRICTKIHKGGKSKFLESMDMYILAVWR